METLKTVLIAAIVACITAGGLVTVLPKDGNGNPTAPTFGALAGPDIASPYLRWGDVTHWAALSAMTQATTTVCAIQSPAATSTLVAAGLNWTVGTTTDTSVTIAKAANAFATTTVLEREPVAANALVSMIVPANYSTLATSTLIFAPNQFVVVGIEGGTGTFSPTGTCHAEFRQVAY